MNNLKKLAERLGYEVFRKSHPSDKLYVKKEFKNYHFDPLNKAEQSQEIQEEFKLAVTPDADNWLAEADNNIIAEGKTIREAILNCGLKVVEL